MGDAWGYQPLGGLGGRRRGVSRHAAKDMPSLCTAAAGYSTSTSSGAQ